MPLRDKHLSILWPLFPALIAISFWFGVKAGGDNLLKDNKTAVSGIGSLERAGSVHEAQKIIDSWNRKAPERRTRSEIENASFLSSILSNDGRMLTNVARRSLVFDLFFIIFYAFALAVACLLAATEIAVRRPKTGSRLVALGIRLAYLQILTASLDLVENFALWRMLSGGSIARVWPWLSYGCSIAKYALVALSLLYILIAFVFWVIDHRQHPSTNRAALVTGKLVAVILLSVACSPIVCSQTLKPSATNKTERVSLAAREKQSVDGKLTEEFSFLIKNFKVDHQTESINLNIAISYRYMPNIAKSDYPDFRLLAKDVETFLTKYPNEDDYWEIVNKQLTLALLTKYNAIGSITSELTADPTRLDPYVRSSRVTRERRPTNRR